MADYSWVHIVFETTDPKIVEEVKDKFGHFEEEDEGETTTSLAGEKSYGLSEEVEELLIKRGIAYSRYSDGKYEYDGDEAHWRPGMGQPRVFDRQNNGGRVLHPSTLPQDATNEELGAFVREYFEFKGVGDA